MWQGLIAFTRQLGGMTLHQLYALGGELYATAAEIHQARWEWDAEAETLVASLECNLRQVERLAEPLTRW